jgi:hypothetical protein
MVIARPGTAIGARRAPQPPSSGQISPVPRPATNRITSVSA